jgi:hypothetical protein
VTFSLSPARAGQKAFKPRFKRDSPVIATRVNTSGHAGMEPPSSFRPRGISLAVYTARYRGLSPMSVSLRFMHLNATPRSFIAFNNALHAHDHSLRFSLQPRDREITRQRSSLIQMPLPLTRCSSESGSPRYFSTRLRGALTFRRETSFNREECRRCGNMAARGNEFFVFTYDSRALFRAFRARKVRP